MHPAAREALLTLGRVGARVVAAGVDAALETANEVVTTAAQEVSSRISKGRAHAQKIGRKPSRRVTVDIRTVDEQGFEVEEDEEDE
jgi:hypothetical protein